VGHRGVSIQLPSRGLRDFRSHWHGSADTNGNFFGQHDGHGSDDYGSDDYDSDDYGSDDYDSDDYGSDYHSVRRCPDLHSWPVDPMEGHLRHADISGLALATDGRD